MVQGANGLGPESQHLLLAGDEFIWPRANIFGPERIYLVLGEFVWSRAKIFGQIYLPPRSLGFQEDPDLE